MFYIYKLIGTFTNDVRPVCFKIRLRSVTTALAATDGRVSAEAFLVER